MERGCLYLIKHKTAINVFGILKSVFYSHLVNLKLYGLQRFLIYIYIYYFFVEVFSSIMVVHSTLSLYGVHIAKCCPPSPASCHGVYIETCVINCQDSFRFRRESLFRGCGPVLPGSLPGTQSELLGDMGRPERHLHL